MLLITPLHVHHVWGALEGDALPPPCFVWPLGYLPLLHLAELEPEVGDQQGCLHNEGGGGEVRGEQGSR